MNTAHVRKYLINFVLILLCACSPQVMDSGPTASPAPAVIPVDLAGPEMKVGSTFLYADGSTLVAVPGGSFVMGAGGHDNPQRQVNLSDFWIYKTKVTNAQYAYCVAMGQCTPPQLKVHSPFYEDPLHSNDPMVGVNYDQATAYCNFVNARLPTEAEWEKTARGPDGNVYPWGDGAPGCDLLNYSTCVGGTTPVTNYPAGQSYYHAFDMEGNALEWVADWYQADYYLSAPTDNPQGPDDGRERSVRSSAFNSGGDQTQAFVRSYSSPDTVRDNLGFRCVVEADDINYFAPFCEYPATYGTDGVGGATVGEQSIVDCPAISIKQSPYCQGTNPSTTVNFELVFHEDPYSLYYDAPPNCDGQDLGPYDCKPSPSGNDRLVFCSYCNVTLVSPPLCPDGYSYDADSKTCVGQTEAATAGACLPGFTLGPRVLVRTNDITTLNAPITATAGQCCSYNPQVSDSPSIGPNVRCLLQAGTNTCQPAFPSCPTGTSFDGQECISVTHPRFCKIESVIYNSCTAGGGGGNDVGGGGPAVCADPGNCGSGWEWNTNTCTCECTTC
jgi:formylglycine-generating enzyme required for sulfatase activity